MKIQCSCGTKVAFDVTPEMAVNPVQFTCPNCGLDNSLLVNQLIRQELGVTDGAAAPPPSPIAPIPAKPAIRVVRPGVVAAPVAAEAAPAGVEFCTKHPGKEATHNCQVCGKAMCPECMALSGYVCSPLCRNKAETRGQAVPVYAQQKSVIEARRWRTLGLLAKAVGGVVVLLLGFWIWYAWFGSVPKVAFAMRFNESAHTGAVRLAAPGQLVYLHNGELGRIDMARGKPAWTRQLVDPSKFAAEADATLKQLEKAREEYYATAEDADDFRIPSREQLIEELVNGVMDRLELHLAGQNLWVTDGDLLTRYDWATGQPGMAIQLEGSTFTLRRQDVELQVTELGDDATSEVVQHVNLVTGDVRKETVARPLPPKLMALLAASATQAPAQFKTRNSKNTAAVTAKVVAANETRRPAALLDPQQLAGQAQGLSYAGKLALPVLLANARNQQRLEAEMAESAPARPPSELDLALNEWDSTQIVPAADGPVQFTRLLIERKVVEREAMKAAPKKSALDGNVSAANSMSLANDMLNEMQREQGSKVTEDVSRYQVTITRANAATPVWTGEVTGMPSYHALQTMDIITAGTSVMAMDHENKKLWQGVLNFPVRGGISEFEEDANSDASGGEPGPCVERGDTIYVFDQGSLTAFDRTTGNARWRLPSVGISGLWFDDAGMIYVNTTSASPEKVRYSKQIDLGDPTLTQILKVDPKTGKTLWSRTGAKHICYLWKKYLYTADRFAGDDADGGTTTGMEQSPFVRIRRIDAGSGSILWEHVQPRCPLDMQFHENTIQLMFKKEVQHLKFIVL